MKTKSILLVVMATICAFSTLRAQSQPYHDNYPKHEMRAVWVATVFGLDWPKAGETAEKQREELRQILRDSKKKGANAIFFQVVSRADAVYPSERLPWAPWLTGTPGNDPGWDPLEVAIEEAHRLGMDLHAWYNVYTSGNDRTPYSQHDEPRHIQAVHPEWIDTVLINNDYNGYYLNPGYPGVREWIAGNVLEIVDRYDVDGIHFDYIRYGADYERDDSLFQQYNPESLPDLNTWRRENVNNFVRLIYPAIKERKPWVKVGSSVIGGYQNFPGSWPGFWGYDNVHQDGRAWVAEGYHDYLAPMLYTTIGRKPLTGRTHDSPDFAWLLQQWVDHRSERHIYAGLGTYVPDVRDELPRQLDTIRALGAHGHAHFRYRFLDSFLMNGRYDYPALVPPMPWMNPAIPPPPENLRITVERVSGQWQEEMSSSGGAYRLVGGPSGMTDYSAETGYIIHLDWEKPPFGRNPDPFMRFAVYRVEAGSYNHSHVVINDAQFLVDITGVTHIALPHLDDGLEYDYLVTAVSRNQMEGAPAMVTVVASDANRDPEYGPNRDSGTDLARPHDIRLYQNYPNPFNSKTTIRFYLPEAQRVTLAVYDMTGRKVALAATGEMAKGFHRISFDAGSLSSGVYMYRLNGSHRIVSGKMTLVK